MQNTTTRRARQDAWMEVFKTLPSSAMTFDAVMTTGLIGAVYSTPDREYTAVPAEDWGYIIVQRGVGQVDWVENHLDLNRAARGLRHRAAVASFDAEWAAS